MFCWLPWGLTKRRMTFLIFFFTKNTFQNLIETSAKIKLKEQLWFLTKCCSCKSCSQNSGNEKKPEFFLAGSWKMNLAKKMAFLIFCYRIHNAKLYIKNMSNSIWLMIIQCSWQKIIHSSDVSRAIEGFDVSGL